MYMIFNTSQYFNAISFLVLLMLASYFVHARIDLPPGDDLKVIKHKLDLPAGFELPIPDAIPVVLTDYNKVVSIPKKFDFPKEIISQGLLPKSTMVRFLWLNNQKLELNEIEAIANFYIKEAALEGVNHDIAFIQMVLETGYLQFKGDVKKNQNNFCGLGAIGNGAAGSSFSSMEMGVRAHIQHLKVYASTEELKNEKVSVRTGNVKRGSAKNIYDLAGKWATDPLYGKKLEFLLARIYEGGIIVQKKKTSILFD